MKRTAIYGLSAAGLTACKENRGGLVCFLIVFAIAYSFQLASPWAIAYIIDGFVIHGFSEIAYTQAYLGLSAFLILNLVGSTLHHLGRYLQAEIAYDAAMGSLRKMYFSILRLPITWHIENHSGASSSKLKRGYQAIWNYVDAYIWQLTEGFVKTSIALILLFTINYWIGLLVVAFIILTMLIMTFLSRVHVQHLKQKIDFDNRLNSLTFDYLSNVTTVKTLSLEERALKHLSRVQPEGLEYTKNTRLYNELKWGSTSFAYAFVISGSLAIFFFSGHSEGETFEVGRVYVLLDYLLRIFASIWAMTDYLNRMLEDWAGYQECEELLELSESSHEDTKRSSKSEFISTSLKNLRFRYASDESSGLDIDQLNFSKSEKIALIGESGAGKSTLLKILAGMLPTGDIDECSIDSNPSSLKSLSERTLLVPQEPEVFHETIGFNIALREEWTKEELIHPLKLVSLKAFVDSLPDGLDTDLFEKGLNISGGQKQRLALARVLHLAKDCPILLLDEPTSSVDPATEYAVYEQIFEHFAKSTIISSLHRLQLIPLFDRIILMDNGQIVEQGTFQDLTEARGLFAKIWTEFQEQQNTD